jgi:3-deoxy-D-manno-octulosonate 8-phosphate phosphatase (KDO 8-P phosphatase)
VTGSARQGNDKGRRAIKGIALDVDGVLTDGGFYWNAEGSETKRFSFTDVMGVSLARRAGFVLALISGEPSPLVDRFAEKMGIVEVEKNCKDKAKALARVAGRNGLEPHDFCFMGDDINDLGAMALAGLAVAPANAAPEVQAFCDIVTAKAGGNGAVREMIDALLADPYVPTDRARMAVSVSLTQPRRMCPVCGDGQHRTLVYSQRFEAPTRNGVHAGYDVVVCDRCGFGFADSLPPQTLFDRYYRNMAKTGEMLDSAAGHIESAGTIARNRHSLQNILPHVQRGSRVLEVGCYTGYLLSLVRAAVPESTVVGLDPSEFAARVGRERHGVDVRNVSIFDDEDLGVYDVVIVLHVLEHVVDLRPLLARLRELLAEGGTLYVEVPDASRFTLEPSAKDPAGGRTEPYLEFNFEHINYFTPTSLSNLMSVNGFVPVAVESQESTLPVIASTWRSVRLEPARETLPALQRYVRDCADASAPVSKTLRDLKERDLRVAVWGAGPHTQRLIGSGQLDPASVEVFIDSNPAFHGGTLAGRPIVAPEVLDGYPDLPVLVSSFRFEREIADRIRGEGRLNEILLMYADTD